MTAKRFINDIDNGKLIDTKGELSTIDYSDKVDFYELWEFLNKLSDENERLKEQWKEKRHEDINELAVIAMKYKALEKENEHLKEFQQKVLQNHLDGWRGVYNPIDESIIVEICVVKSIAEDLGVDLE